MKNEQETLKSGLLGNAIRQARIENGYSQEQLAEMIDITVTHLKHLESEHRKPSVEVLFKLINVLNLSIDSLFAKDKNSLNSDYKIILLMLEKCDEKQLRIIKNVINGLLDQ